MINLKYFKMPLPGLRNIKTSLSIFVCLALYQIIGREGVLLAAIAAIMCLQDSVEKSVSTGVSRTIGTIIGGLFGVIFTFLDITHYPYPIWLFACMFGIVSLIYVCNLIHMKESVVIGCIVYLILVIEPVSTAPIIYSINRVIDTLIGIVVAVIVNVSFFRPKPDRTAIEHTEGDLKMDYEIKKAGHHKISKWSGGATSEVFIFPKNSIYAERDFFWRLSTATVELEESKFTKLTGYLRHLMVLDGNVKIIHEGQHTIKLGKFDKDFFSGDWNTKSYGKCIDFNLMLKEGLVGRLNVLHNMENINIVAMTEDECNVYETSGFYILEDDVNVNILGKGGSILNQILNKGDFIIFHSLDSHVEDEIVATLNKSDEPNKIVVAIRVDICSNYTKE